ncbi:MAG: SpoIIE family protein phosphatase, partial [Candidatus Hydrogenedentes bacterium]|nr:SpoIIE family protein phosphatase [Candidatus Hydrogenedentota bacterium]
GEISANYDACRLQDRILDAALPAIRAQRGALFLANELGEMTPCPLCGLIHSYVNGELSHAERDGLSISNTVAQQVLRDGKSIFYEDCGSNEGAQASASIMSLSLHSIICVPLVGKTSILGILYIDTDRPDQRYGQEDLLLASAVGVSAGIALDNVFMHKEVLEKQRMDQEIETAWAIQEGFLCREWNVDDSRFAVFGDTVPAKTVGGDFYDFVQPDPDTVCVLIGDVSGKGVPAALTMAQMLAEFRILVKEIDSPALLLKQLNDRLVLRSRRGMFCTLTYARLDLRNGELMWANAGHLPSLFISPETNAYKGNASGPPLGVVEDAEWSNEAILLDPGTTVLYFTDGIIEAHPREENAEEFGLARLWGTPEYGTPPDLVLKDVNDALRSYLKDAEAHDDCTMISLRYLGCKYEDTD